MQSWRVINDDCRRWLARLARDGVRADAVVCDPSYELGMRGWDKTGVANDVRVWRGAYEASADDAVLLAFGGGRTFHRLACAIEDGGWHISDCLVWLYAGGFPLAKARLRPSWEPCVMATKGGALVLRTDECRGVAGRHPANAVIDESVAAGMDGDAEYVDSGERLVHERKPAQSYPPSITFVDHVPGAPTQYNDEGGPSRFFYCPKISTAEREAGLHFAEYKSGDKRRNLHPTVKPLALMRWLVRLAAAPGSLVIDPFCGSGSTGMAAVSEGCSFLGCELSPEYAKVARKRIGRAAGVKSI